MILPKAPIVVYATDTIDKYSVIGVIVCLSVILLGEGLLFSPNTALQFAGKVILGIGMAAAVTSPCIISMCAVKH